MDSVLKVYESLLKNVGVVPHSTVAHHPKDIDLYVPENCLQAARRVLEANSYICVSNTAHQVIYSKFIDGNLFMYDLCSDYSYYFCLFSEIRFSEHGNTILGSDLELNKSVKKLSNQSNLGESDILRLKSFFALSKNFTSCPKNSWSTDGALSLSELIKKKRKFTLLYLRLKLLIRGFNKGKSFAFVGPDGSGKGFFIDKLKKAASVKVIYMGDWFFKMQPLYSLLMKLPSPINRFLYLFYYIENLVRRLKVAFWVALGKTVFIDRFPGTNTPVTLTGFPGFINRLSFKMTPKPDLFVVLHATPEVVFERKQELSVCQIAEIQDKQRKLIINYPNVVINTEDLDNSLNFLLEKLYEI